VHKTAGNFNNHLGAPLSMLALPDDAEAAVLELGMNHAGEIAALSSMVNPDIGLVSNVRAAHLEFFDALDGIAAAKGELFATMRDDATSVVNLDDMHVRVQATRHIGPRITYGQHAAADVKLEAMESKFHPGTAFRFHFRDTVRTVRLKMGGAHAAFNALASLAGVIAAGEELDPAIATMQEVEAGAGRGRVHLLDRDIVVVDDSYNCSPAALASVLETFKLADPPGRKVLVFGDMQELGHLSEALHREAGKRAAVAGVSLLFAVGPLARNAAEIARRAGVAEVHHHADSNKAAESVGEFLRSGDMVVVKGSRGMKLERVVQALVGTREGAS
jgi:UDP-N-acetylmuramoyl-tripeptide--D-alanyl-D-alanine ligase